jgi:hypothetical protein
MLPTIRWATLAGVATTALAATPASDANTTSNGDFDNATNAFYEYLFIICASLVALLVVWRTVLESVRYVRTLTCLNNPSQRYFSNPSPWFATFKKTILYAPVFRRRHNREFQLSTAVNIGTLPTRLQLLFLSSYLATNAAFCVVSIQWKQPFAIAATDLRNRSGTLAVVNMAPLFILAARNNPLIVWLNISYDTFNLLHRWFGRIVIFESLVHVGAWCAAEVNESGWSAVIDAAQESSGVVFGTIVSSPNISIRIILFHSIYL